MSNSLLCLMLYITFGLQTAFREMFEMLAEFISPLQFPPLQCEDKDCQDLAVLKQLAKVGRIAMPTDIK